MKKHLYSLLILTPLITILTESAKDLLEKSPNLLRNKKVRSARHVTSILQEDSINDFEKEFMAQVELLYSSKNIDLKVLPDSVIPSLTKTTPYQKHAKRRRFKNSANIVKRHLMIEETNGFENKKLFFKLKDSRKESSKIVYGMSACAQLRRTPSLKCNTHNSKKECICRTRDIDDEAKVPSSLASMRRLLDGKSDQRTQLPYCDKDNFLPAIGNVQETILTLGIGFPIPEEFLQYPDEMLAEDIEYFTNIKRNTLFIYRKYCNSANDAIEFQLGIVHENFPVLNDSDARPQLRTLSPEIFLKNPAFMNQPTLNIKYVKYSTSLRSLYKPNENNNELVIDNKNN